MQPQQTDLYNIHPKRSVYRLEIAQDNQHSKFTVEKPFMSGLPQARIFPGSFHQCEPQRWGSWSCLCSSSSSLWWVTWRLAVWTETGPGHRHLFPAEIERKWLWFQASFVHNDETCKNAQCCFYKYIIWGAISIILAKWGMCSPIRVITMPSLIWW